MLRLSCQQASRLLSQRQDEPLPLGRRLRLRLHLLYCDACTNVSRQFDTLRLAMQHWRDKD
ncbi:MAG TPA: zf-HC2 domain-containing protein [Rudaea sp.]|nr:zf-HC2 domain-containing protein [Rudaea sp.]